MKFRIPGVCALVVLMLAGAALATDDDVKKQPGYVDFGAMSVFGNEEKLVEISIKSHLIAFVASTVRNSDPDLSDMLSKLKEIRVEEFPIEAGKHDEIAQKTDEISKKLEKDGWENVVTVRSPREREHTYIYMKMVGNVMQGLVVMSVDRDEGQDKASFVNIVGELDPEQLGKLGSRFNINSLDSLDTQIRIQEKIRSEKDRHQKH